MSTVEPKIFERLTRVATELIDVVNALRGFQPVFPVEAAALVEKRMCLVGEHKVAKGERYVRGNCGSHGQQIRDALQAGEATESELISLGLLAPEATSGRKPKSGSKLRDLLEARRQKEPRLSLLQFSDGIASEIKEHTETPNNVNAATNET